MKTTKKANWYLVFKVECPYCSKEMVSMGIPELYCGMCEKNFKLSKEVQELYSKMDTITDKPAPQIIVRKNT